MPTVPTYDNFQVGMGGGQQQYLDAPQVKDVSGAQAQEMGRAISQAGQDAGRIALDMQQEANALRVTDTLNQAKEMALRLTYDQDGFTKLKGWDALHRQSGVPLADEYGGKLQESISSLADSLGNDAQKKMFSEHAATIMQSFKQQAMQHESQEFKTYNLSVQDGVQSTALRDIALNYNNPQAVEAAVGRVKASTFQQARLMGYSAEWQEAHVRDSVSNAHKTALMTALDKNDPSYAKGYLDKFKDQMSSDDIFAVNGMITKQMDYQVASKVATSVISDVGRKFETPDTDRAFNILLGTESAGRQVGKDGKPLTSSAGAIGIAQVMPATAQYVAKKYGLKWDDNAYRTDAQYNMQLGKLYFQEQLKTFSGELPKAYAAYNAGPDTVAKAVKDAGPDGDWVSAMAKYQSPKNHAETVGYITKNMKAFGAGDGAYSKPTLEEAQQKALATLGNNPSQSLVKATMEQVEKAYKTHELAVKDRQDEVVAGTMKALQENGGDYHSLPVNLLASIPADKVPTLIDYGKKISSNGVSTDMALYQKLETDPAYLKGLSDNQFYQLKQKLSDGDFKHFADARQKLLTGQVKNTSGDYDSSAANQYLDGRLMAIGIDPKPKKADESELSRLGGIRQYVRDQVLTAQKQSGKKFDDAQLGQFIDGLFAKNYTFRSYLSFGLFDTKGEIKSRPLLQMQLSDFPSDLVDSTRKDLKRQGRPSTDSDVLSSLFSIWKYRK